MEHEFKLKFNAILKAYEGKYTVNSTQTIFLKHHCHIRSVLPGVINHSICRNVFFMNFKIGEN